MPRNREVFVCQPPSLISKHLRDHVRRAEPVTSLWPPEFTVDGGNTEYRTEWWKSNHEEELCQNGLLLSGLLLLRVQFRH